MVALFVLLLIIFLAVFFGFDNVTQFFGAAADAEEVSIPLVQGFQVTLNLPNLRAFLGGGIIFCEFIIIAFSVVDRILDTLRALIRPIAVLLPLSGFVLSAYKTFEPIITILLPTYFGGRGEPTEIATAVDAPAFYTNVLLTFGMMVIYLITTYFLKEDSKEVKALRAEITKLRRQRG